jgi:hypothetical protein
MFVLLGSVSPLLWGEAIVGLVIESRGGCLRIRAGLDELLVDFSCAELPAHLDQTYVVGTFDDHLNWLSRD